MRCGKGQLSKTLEVIKRLALSAVVVVLSACDAGPVAHEAILGKWKSDAERTLDSMNAAEGVTPEARALFEDDFFGHLIVEWKEDEARVINENDDYDSGFEPYEVIEVTNKYIRVREWSSSLGEFEESTMHMDGNCYYMVTSKFEFREYFCEYEK